LQLQVVEVVVVGKAVVVVVAVQQESM